MAKKNILLAIILALLFALIASVGLDGTKSRTLTAQNSLEVLGAHGHALALLGSSGNVAVSFGQ